MHVKPTPNLSGNEKIGFLSYIPSTSQDFSKMYSICRSWQDQILSNYHKN